MEASMPFSRLKPFIFFFILILASACNGGTKSGGSTAVIGSAIVAHCGNSTCETSLGETAASCPADCSASPGTGSTTPPGGTGPGATGPGATPPGGTPPGAGASATCGNGFCESGETHTSCSTDCGDPSVAGFEIISLNPSVIIMNAGTTSSPIRIEVRRLGGDASILNLGISNVSPLVAGLSSSPTTIGSSNTADFTISADVAVPSDEYRLTLKVDSSVGVRYITLTVKVLPASTPGGTPPGSGTTTCGDGTCTPPETTATCPADCGFDPSRPSVCGDGFCHPAETPASCPGDCPVSSTCDNDGLCETGETPATCSHDCAPGGSVCGNGRCESGETTALCAADCPPAPGGGMGSITGTFEALPPIPMRIESSMYADYPLQIRRIDGFAGDVSVSIENVTPTRDAASILPASPVLSNPSTNTPIRIGVNPFIAPGTRIELTLSLISSGITRRVTIPIEVTQGFVVDNMDPISATIAAGGTRTVEFNVNRRGETEAITMELDENPPDSPFTVATRTIPSGATSGEMRINVNPSARPGDYRLTFYLHTSRTSRFLSFPITVTAPAPSTRGLELVSLTPGAARITAGTSLTEHIVVNRNSEPTTDPILVRGRDVSPIPSAGSIRLSGRIEPGSSEADVTVTVSPEVPTGNYILLLEISGSRTMIPYPLAIQVVSPGSGSGSGTPPMGFIPPDMPGLDLPPRACINDTDNLWVDDDRGDDATHEGTRARPLKSVIYARELAARASPQKNVCVFEGNYSGRSGPCSGGVCTNYTLTVDVNIYGGFAWNGSSTVRSNIRDPLARRTVLTNDGGRPVVSFYPSSESKTLEGFRIIAGPQYSSGALVSVQGPALLKNNTIAIGDMAPRSPRPSESSRFMRVGVSVSTTSGNSIRNAVLESNQISVGRIYPSHGAAVGVLIENNTARGDASVVDFTIKKNQIEVGSAPVASVGILATSNRIEPVNSYRIEDNTLIYGAGLQISDSSSFAPCSSADGADTVTCVTSESGYLGAVPGESGGIILGKKLNIGLTEPIFEETRFTSAQILRNNIRPKLRYFGIALSGNASYGIALQNGDMYTASVVGSNMVQASRARKISSALYLHKAMVKIYNNTLRAGLVSGGNLVSCSSETIPVPGGVDEVSYDCVLDSVSSAVFVDDQIPSGTESYFSNLDLVNNIFSGERGDATHTPAAGIFEVYNRPTNIRERSNFNSIVLLRNNFFDTSLSNPLTFYRIGELEAWRIPFTEIVTLGTRIRYASAGGQAARSISNTRGDPGLTNPSQFELHLLPDSAILGGGDCSADILRLNPKEIDGTDFPSMGCAIGADQYVSP